MVDLGFSTSSADVTMSEEGSGLLESSGSEPIVFEDLDEGVPYSSVDDTT